MQTLHLGHCVGPRKPLSYPSKRTESCEKIKPDHRKTNIGHRYTMPNEAAAVPAASAPLSPLSPPLPTKPDERLLWGRLYGSSGALAIAAAARSAWGWQ